MESKEELLGKLNFWINGAWNLHYYIEIIHDLRKQLKDKLTPEENLDITNRIKNWFQRDANKAIDSNNGSGLVIAGTGSGKSKIAIDRISKIFNNYFSDMGNMFHPNPRVLLIVPTEKLRDEGWKNEFKKWGYEPIWGFIKAICYASLITNYINTNWDLVILDEAHNITEANSIFFKQNSIKNVVALTATEPRDRQKIKILESIGCKKVYELTLDQSIKLGIVAPYNITIVTMNLDSKDKYIKAGSKDKPFMTTEVKQYEYMTRLDLSNPSKWNKINRYKFFSNCKTKTEAALKILEHLIPEDKRTLIFCGSKDQANKVCLFRYYSKPIKPKKVTTPELITNKDIEKNLQYKQQIKEYQGDSSLKMFLNGEINRLSCVEALDEGHNLGGDLDCAFILQLNSNPLNMVQEMGRVLRWREGYTGKIIILTIKDTVDLEWTNKALRELNSSKIEMLELEKIRLRQETIKFN